MNRFVRMPNRFKSMMLFVKCFKVIIEILDFRLCFLKLIKKIFICKKLIYKKNYIFMKFNPSKRK